MKNTWMLLAAALAVLLGVNSASQTQLTPLRLSDTIKQGSGVINLLKDIDAATMEAFRLDNAGRLVFAVDVNENNSGLETPRSQGVTVQSVSLDVSFPGGLKKHYTQFSTETQALVAPAGANVRQRYYTLLGDAGSGRITSNGKIGSQYFDSTLKLVVADDLSTATAAVLTVQLLKTASSFGDAENFYDYSGGFEDMAIVTQASAKYFDEVLPIQDSKFRIEAPAVELSPEGVATQSAMLAAATPSSTPSSAQIVSASTALSWLPRPALGSYSIVAYEDLYPSKGDYDFNDAVVAYRYQLGLNSNGQVERIDGVAYLVARGSN